MRGASVAAAPGRHWPEYLIEAGALGCFMVSACLFGALLDHPASPVRQMVADPWARRAIGGTMMGLTAIALIYSPWGKRSGAHMNPVFTFTFWRLGRIPARDASFYVAAQFAGGALGVLLAGLVLGTFLSDPPVRYVVTMPGALGVTAAFGGELIISGVLMTAVLASNASPRLMRYTGVIAGILIAVYITVEAPLSGMSMNPARTVASALAANDWTAVWIYFTAPLIGMTLSAELFVRLRGRTAIPCPKYRHALPCIFCDARGAREEVVVHLEPIAATRTYSRRATHRGGRCQTARDTTSSSSAAAQEGEHSRTGSPRRASAS